MENTYTLCWKGACNYVKVHAPDLVKAKVAFAKYIGCNLLIVADRIQQVPNGRIAIAEIHYKPTKSL